jgi:hypothetical protein
MFSNRSFRLGARLALEALERRALPSFITAPSYFVGPYSLTAVAAGDFNGDGRPDLVTADGTSQSAVSVLLGKGDGTFRAPMKFPAGAAAYAVAVGDLNGDGRADLAVVNNTNSGQLSVLLGTGNGAFGTPVSYVVGPNPDAVAVADFNGDGRPDLVAASPGTYPQYNGTVSVLLGKGDGTFQPAVAFGAGYRPYSVAVGDVNGDHHPDLAVTNYAWSGTVSILLGRGDGTFRAAVGYAAGTLPRSLALGDFDGDSDLDLAVTNYGYGQTGTVTVLRGVGDGTFGAPSAYEAGYKPVGLAVGDFDGDARPDLVVTNGSATVGILHGQGDGSFQHTISYLVGSDPVDVAVSDFNADGHSDLAAANWGSGSVSAILGNGDGTFRAAASYEAGSPAVSVASADFNGDGRPDLAVTNNNYTQGAVHVMLGKGNGTFVAGGVAGVFGAYAIAAADFDSDGRPDLAVTGLITGQVAILRGNGDGTFQPAVYYAAGELPQSLAVADFDGDGHPDLAVVDQTYGAGKVNVLRGNGDGTFQAAVGYAVADSPQSLAVGDFDGDGRPDLAVTTWRFGTDWGAVAVLRNNGNGSFKLGGYYPAGPSPYAVAAGDLDGDGDLDLAVTSHYANRVSVLLGNGNGTFQAPASDSDGFLNEPVSVVMADFDRDGRLDIAVGDISGFVNVFRGKGDGSLQAPLGYRVGDSANSLVAQDFDGNGYLDVAVADWNSYSPASLTVLLNDGAWPPPNPPLNPLANRTPITAPPAHSSQAEWISIADSACQCALSPANLTLYPFAGNREENRLAPPRPRQLALDDAAWIKLFDTELKRLAMALTGV